MFPYPEVTQKLWDQLGSSMQDREMQVNICEAGAGEKERYFRLLAKSRLRTVLTSCIKCRLSAVRTTPDAHLI